MSRQVDIRVVRTHLSRLVEEVAAGNEIIIAKAGKPIARLTALEVRSTPRKPGLLKARIRVTKDFDAPLRIDL